MRNSEKVIQCLNDADVVDSAKKMMYSVIVVLCDQFKYKPELYKKLYPKYKEQLDKFNNILMDIQQDQKLSPTQDKNWVPWTKLQKLVKSWRRKLQVNKTETNMFMALLSALYLSTDELPPNRNIYASFKFYPKNKPDPYEQEVNYYWNQNFVYNDTKSKRKYRIRLGKSAMKVTRLIEEYHRIYNKTEWLVINPNTQKPMSTSSFGDYIQKMTSQAGPNLGSRMIRTIYVTDYLNNRKSINERKRIAALMDHTFETQQNYYDKIK